MNIKKPIDSIKKAYFKAPILKSEFDNFKKHIQIYKNSINNKESEEFNKNLIKKLFVNTNFTNYTINTKEKIDLAIYVDKNIEVLIETKNQTIKQR